MALLEHVAAGGPPQTHAELMRALDVPRSTLSDMLADLRGLGYLHMVGRRYVAGPRLIALISRGLDESSMVLAGVRPVLDQIAAATRETAVFSIRSRGGIVSLMQSPGTDPIRYVATLWEPFPLETTSPGMVFLAYGADPPPELAHVREQGYAMWAPADDQPAAIAMPVRDPEGAAVAALVVLGPKDRIVQRETLLRDELRAGVGALEARNGENPE